MLGGDTFLDAKTARRLLNGPPSGVRVVDAFAMLFAIRSIRRRWAVIPLDAISRELYKGIYYLRPSLITDLKPDNLLLVNSTSVEYCSAFLACSACS